MRTIAKPMASPLAALLAAFIAAVPAAAANAAGAAPASAGNDPARRAAEATGNWGDTGARLSRIERAMWDRDPKAIPQLREWAASDPDDRVRERSVGALALLGDTKASPVFLRLLDDDPSADVRRAGAEAIGLLRPPVDIERLARPLREDPDPFVRAECARAIGRIGGPRSSHWLLVSLVQDASPEVRVLSAKALCAQALASKPLPAVRSPEVADVVRAVAQNDNSVLVRIYAVRTLVAISPASSLSLFKALWDGSGDADLRLEAFRGLLAAEGGDAWERAGLADADERIRFLAFQAWVARLGETPPGILRPSFPARLEEFLTDRVRGIRELAREQLEALGYKVRPSGFGYAVDR